MARDPAFLFYPGDWLGGTMTFSRSHKGAYMDLLMGQYNNGHMTIQDIRTILGKNDFEAMWDSKLKAKFIEDENGMFFNQKLEYEINRRKNYTESRRKNLNNKEINSLSHMGGHMENGNGNGNTSETINTLKNGKSKSGNKQFKSTSAQGQSLYADRISNQLSEINGADGANS